VVALAEATLDEDEIVENTKGFAFKIKRIIMAPNTYPKSWRSKAVVNN
jgi:H/ACA ribonucleoprotein complex subunit 4